jgi:hypothetical protein
MAKSDPERDKRMAEALRANLRRRKAQSREQEPRAQDADGEAPVSPPEAPSPR